jgi:DNA primase
MDTTTKPDLLEVMRRAGVDLARVEGRRNGMARCAFHEDHGRPNMAVWTESARWRCFRCGIGGDVFDFVGFQIFGNNWNTRNGDMFREVLQKLDMDEIPKVKIQSGPPPVPKEVALEISHALGLASRVYHLALMSKIGEEAREYLKSRMISEDTMRSLRLGYATEGVLAGTLAGYPKKLRQAAEAAGLYHMEREWLQGRIIFPDISKKNIVKHMVGRDLKPDAKLRYLSLPGLPKTVYRLGYCSRKKPIILLESMMDTVNLWEMGYQGTGVNGTGLAYYLASALKRFPIIGILPQNDEAGMDAIERWKIELPHARILKIPYKKGEKDVNDLLRIYGKEETKKIIDEALKEVNIEISYEN